VITAIACQSLRLRWLAHDYKRRPQREAANRIGSTILLPAAADLLSEKIIDHPRRPRNLRRQRSSMTVAAISGIHLHGGL
jgi:hypothetical protein